MSALHRAAIALAVFAASFPAMSSPLSCRFEAAADAGGHVTLQFTLHNPGPGDVQLLRWGSPFEGAWFGRFVSVHAAGAELPFEGAMRKSGEPSARDYLALPAGKDLTATLTLDDAFRLPATGPLTIQSAWQWHDVMTRGQPPRPRAAHQGQAQDCGAVTLQR